MKVMRLVGTSWLIHDGKKGIIIDAARKRRLAAFNKKLEPLKIEIPILFMTHTHYDHAGSTEALRAFTGAKVLVGAAESSCLKSGNTPVPHGTHPMSRLISDAGHRIASARTEHYDAVTRDIVPIEAERGLEEFGFDAVIYPLGAHTEGSIGLFIDSYFFAGDTVFGLGGSLYPPFADRPDEIRGAWETILGTNAAFICPGHGPMIRREKLLKQYIMFFGNKKTASSSTSEGIKLQDQSDK